MAGAVRVKGQEVQVVFLNNGQILGSEMAIQSNSLKAQLEVLSEGFLGETTNRRDDIFNGWTGDVSIQMSGPQPLIFLNSVIDVARRRVASGVGINVKHTYTFTNGRIAIIVFPNVSIGEVGIDTGSRSDYVKLSLPYEVEAANITVV